MTFACERCGSPVEVEVRRNHRYCVGCSTWLRVAKKRADRERRDSGVRVTRTAANWAELEVARILGLERNQAEARTHCEGCGAALKQRTYRGGVPRRWCSERCRMRIARRGTNGAGSGYFGALLADPCVYCG